MLGEQAFGGSEAQGQQAQQQVPTSVDAGLSGESTTEESVWSPLAAALGLFLVLMGGVCARLWWVRARG